jgi:hypothetical protein
LTERLWKELDQAATAQKLRAADFQHLTYAGTSLAGADQRSRVRYQKASLDPKRITSFLRLTSQS